MSPPGESHTPAALFMTLWRQAAAWSGPERVGARPAGIRFERMARQALLRNHDPALAYTALTHMIGIGASDQATFRGQVLTVMKAIDEAFYLVHPRSEAPGPATGIVSPLTDWLRDARDERLLTGAYRSEDDQALVPRGPLLRGPRHAAATSADSLADRFAALSVVRLTLEQDGRSIRVSPAVTPTASSRGVPPGTMPGAETIAFVPIAEAKDDVLAQERATGDQTWVDFCLDASVDAPGCILNAIDKAGPVDLTIAPEFMVSETHADQLASGLASRATGPRLLVAGTGATNQRSDGQPWNEARAVNASGAEIWRQRKLWPAGLDTDRAKSFGITPPPEGHLIYEDTAAGSELIVADIEGLGRCVILICQDLQAQMLAEQLMIQFQPDWVFVPLLDSGVDENRWMHRRAFELSALTQSRFVIASSTSLAAKAGYPPAACAMAIGPLAPTPDPSGQTDIPRTIRIEHARSSGGARFALMQWRDGRWLSTRLTAG